MPQDELVQGDTVISFPSDSVSQVYVIDKSLCLFFEKEKNEYAISIEKATSRRINIARYGNNRNEVLLADVSYGGNGKLALHDFVQKKIMLIDIERNSITIDTCYVNAQEIIPYKENRWIVLNQLSFKGKENRVFITDDSGQYHKKRHDRFDAFNVIDGTLLYNEEKETIVYLSRHTPQIELIPIGKRYFSVTEINREESIEILGVKEDSVIAYYFVNNVPCCFVGGDYSDDSIWAGYIDEKGKSHLICFDWEGNLERSIMIPGDIKTVSVDKFTGEVYAWVRCPDADYLFRYHV